MKNFMLIGFALLLTACYHSGVGASVDKVDSTVGVDYLFTIQGVKIYRFWDGGNAHYLAIGEGTVADSLIGSKSKYPDAVIKVTK